MKLTEIPFIVEIFFAISTLVFALTIYVISPIILNNKKIMYAPVVLNKIWQKYFK